MNQPIKMYDNRLSANVDLYQIGLPDPFGANALIFFDGTILSNQMYISAHETLSDLVDQKIWQTTNIRHLTPLTT